jgi:hypothetical protein
MAMMACMPNSGWNAWRYHMAEKSPAVQPTRHRRVLTPARFHVALELQKLRLSAEGVGALADLQVEVAAVLLQEEEEAGAVLLLHFGRDWQDRIVAAGFLERLGDMGERGCEAERMCCERVDREVRKRCAMIAFPIVTSPESGDDQMGSDIEGGLVVWFDEAPSAANGSITANFLVSPSRSSIVMGKQP